MGRRNDHSREQQQEMAIAAAELLIVQEGMAGFSMRKVAKAIGYTVGQIYLLFKNQDELFIVLNERTADAVYSALRDRIDDVEDAAEAVRLAARSYIEFANRHPNRWRLLFEHRLPPGSAVPQANVRKVQRLFALIEQRLKELLPAADEHDLRVEATALWSGVHGVAVLSQSNKLIWSGVDDYGILTDRLVQGFV
ncbi:MAG: TetR/AcrR family transcriptional regulator [Oceanococcus sp.]